MSKELGATGSFPKGKLDDGDEGELQFAIAADSKTKKVLIDFGKPVAWLGLDPSDARNIAKALNEKADIAEGS